MLTNGYASFFEIGTYGTLGFWEKEVTPFGLEGGDKIDVSTMHNHYVRTYAAQALYEASDGEITAAYDPGILSNLSGTGGAINDNQTVTIHFPDTSTWDTFGYIQTFSPSALTNGEQPEATITVVFTNLTNATPPAEYEPQYTTGSP
jgi:hypothetical protein